MHRHIAAQHVISVPQDIWAQQGRTVSEQQYTCTMTLVDKDVLHISFMLLKGLMHSCFVDIFYLVIALHRKLYFTEHYILCYHVKEGYVWIYKYFM